MKNLKMSIAVMLLLAVSFTNAQEKEKMNFLLTLGEQFITKLKKIVPKYILVLIILLKKI